MKVMSDATYICPLLTIALKKKTSCETTNCAWWDYSNNRCILASLTDSVENISLEM